MLVLYCTWLYWCQLKSSRQTRQAAILCHIQIVLVYFDQSGIANQQANQLWRDHRRFVLSVMRSFGEGRTQMENKVTEEVGQNTCGFIPAQPVYIPKNVLTITHTCSRHVYY